MSEIQRTNLLNYLNNNKIKYTSVNSSNLNAVIQVDLTVTLPFSKFSRLNYKE